MSTPEEKAKRRIKYEDKRFKSYLARTRSKANKEGQLKFVPDTKKRLKLNVRDIPDNDGS